MKRPDKHILVIFGASGDLTYRKLVPALYDLYTQDMLPDHFAVLGAGRTDLGDDGFRHRMMEGIERFSKSKFKEIDSIMEFCKFLHYHAMDPSSAAGYPLFRKELERLDAETDCGGNYAFYLSTPPSLYALIPVHLAGEGLNIENESRSWRRLIIEKPFGTDINSARDLNNLLLRYYQEHQLFRIDHYLGKETVQNLLVTRFANGIFEPLWNRNFVHHVEITTAESIGVGDRGGYYEQSGAMRDMIQNHLLQMVGLVAMEPPTVMEATAIRNETMKVFQALRPLTDEAIEKDVIRGQYTASVIKGEPVKGYREEKGVQRESRTETYVAMKFYIDNWRWGGVPFYLRTGKRLPTRVSEVVIHFKPTPHKLFLDNQGFLNNGNQMVIRIQPDEGMLLKFGMKIPGAGFDVKMVNMDFHYKDLQDTYVPSAYERLLLDAMSGDQTLYARGEEVEAAWSFVQPILDFWADHPDATLNGYPAGTWGPEGADRLIEGKDISWRYPCRNLTDDGIFCEL